MSLQNCLDGNFLKNAEEVKKGISNILIHNRHKKGLKNLTERWLEVLDNG